MRKHFDIFLSHSSADKTRVRELYDALAALGISSWFDERELHVGDSLYHHLNAALEMAEFVVFCVSHSATTSGWVEREIGGTLAGQLRAPKKRILPVLLDDAPVPPLLADLVWLDMKKSQPSDVARQIRTAIEASRAALRSASLTPRDVETQVEHLLAQLAGSRAAAGFCWAIVSGPSSAGKDVLSYVVLQRLQQSHGLSILRKLTTRPRRPSEPDYVQQLSEDAFQQRSEANTIIFPFRKRGFRYGFDGAQFRTAIHEGTPLLSVFTEFRIVPAVGSALSAAGILTRPFLISVPKQDLLRRVLFRNLPPDEVASRIASIEQDYREMTSRPSLASEYIFIDNGDARAFADAADELTGAIRQMVD
jgi:ribose 1,5-bisphosphokinase PhnN